jgi:hypothetical protein
MDSSGQQLVGVAADDGSEGTGLFHLGQQRFDPRHDPTLDAEAWTWD